MTYDELLEQSITGVKDKLLRANLRSHAANLATDTEKAQLLATVQQIRSSQKGLGWPHMIIGIVGVLALLMLLWWVSGGTFLTEIGPGRPVLMLIVVFATVVYGGMLMNAALFGEATDDVDLDGRFRRAREIFLVFSGICGTVVGFYFGAGEGEGASQPGVELSASLDPAGQITATVAGGDGPFAVALVKDGVILPLEPDPDSANRFVLQPSAGTCPAGGTFQVSGPGGAAYPGIAVGFSEADLMAAQWTGCSSGGPAAGTNAAEPGGAESEAGT